MPDTVTGFTAARMQEIEDAAIVSAAVVGDNLIMTRFDTSTFNAGNVRGAVGPMNPDGNPVGTIIMGGWSVAPTGYLFGGQTIVGGVATYAALAAVYPSWVSGGNLIIPDFNGAVPMHATTSLGTVAGSMTHTLTSGQLAAHTHTGPSHQHSGPSHSHGISFNSGIESGNHTHGVAGTTDNSAPSHTHAAAAAAGEFLVRDTTYSTGFAIPYNTAQTNGQSPVAATWIASTTSNPTTHGHTYYAQSYGASANHTHPINGNTQNDGTGQTGASGTGATGSTGSGTAVDHTPKHLKLRFAVKY